MPAALPSFLFALPALHRPAARVRSGCTRQGPDPGTPFPGAQRGMTAKHTQFGSAAGDNPAFGSGVGGALHNTAVLTMVFCS